jgi:hypothetical protein
MPGWTSIYCLEDFLEHVLPKALDPIIDRGQSFPCFSQLAIMSGAPGMSGPPDLSMIGVAPPPLGVVPNFVDPVNNNAAQLIVTGITLPIAVGFMIMRLMTKALIIHKFSIDDGRYPAYSILLVDLKLTFP